MSDMVPRAELERIVAEERRRRRRAELGLWVIGVIVALGGWGITWFAVDTLETQRATADAEIGSLRRQVDQLTFLRDQLLARLFNLQNPRWLISFGELIDHRRNATIIADAIAQCERTMQSGNLRRAELTLSLLEQLPANSGVEEFKERIAHLRVELDLRRELDHLSTRLAPMPREVKRP